jgi:hypothetical protein
VPGGALRQAEPDTAGQRFPSFREQTDHGKLLLNLGWIFKTFNLYRYVILSWVRASFV